MTTEGEVKHDLLDAIQQQASSVSSAVDIEKLTNAFKDIVSYPEGPGPEYTLTQDLDVNGYYLLNVPTPTENNHAANKEYVDTKVTIYNPLTEDLDAAGFKLTNLGTPVNDNDALRLVDFNTWTIDVNANNHLLKNLGTPVDDNDALRLVDFKTWTIDIDANNHNLKNLALPVDDNDAATKSYVDNTKTDLESLIFLFG